MLAVDLGVVASPGVLWRGRCARQRALRRSRLVDQRRRELGGVAGTARRRRSVASALSTEGPVRVLAKDGNGVAPAACLLWGQRACHLSILRVGEVR